jgi:hypothetical protein
MPTLEDLPLELILEILSFTTAAHNLCPTRTHPLNALASTNKHFHAVVEEYARSLFKQHAPNVSTTRRCRKKWLSSICQFCKHKSSRQACFYANLTCCRKCDKVAFEKMVSQKHLHNLKSLTYSRNTTTLN